MLHRPPTDPVKRRRRSLRVTSGRRSGYSILEAATAFSLFTICLAGIYPVVFCQLKQIKSLEGNFSYQTTYYLVPSTNGWARKLGAMASLATTDPGSPAASPVMVFGTIDTGYSETGTGWTTLANSSAYEQTERYAKAGTGMNTATWQFTGLEPGWYNVQVTWVANSSNATNTPFSVLDGSTNVGTVAVDQQILPVGPTSQGVTWLSLGTFSISGSTLQVQITDAANGYAVANGVMLTAVRNVVTVNSFSRSLSSQVVTANVTVTVVAPP